MLTKDGYILRTRRDKKLAYYAEQYDFSIEEQLNVSDIGMEKLRSIMRDWPREDYEFQYDFCTWKDIERELIKREVFQWSRRQKVLSEVTDIIQRLLTVCFGQLA